MSPVVRLGIGALVLTAVALIGMWIYHNGEFYEEEVDIGLRGEAARNPLLAAGRLMERSGATVHFAPVYTRPPPAGTTLVWPTPRRTLSDNRAQALLDWVDAGGHLVVVSWTLWEDDETDPLLDHLGVEQYLNDYDDSDAGDEDAPVEAQDGATDPADGLPVAMPAREGVLRVAFDPDYRLEDGYDEADWALADRNGIHALRYRWGEGRITALSDHEFMLNDDIGKADHAALTVRLLEPAQERTIWFVYGDDVPSLWHWLTTHAWPVLVAAAVLLAAWLWSTSRRLGPLIPQPPATRRSMVEHVAASGRFLWRRHGSATLHHAAVDAFLRQLQRRHPQWSGLDGTALAAQVAAVTGLPAEHIGQALDTAPVRGEARFAHDIQLIETLRKRL